MSENLFRSQKGVLSTEQICCCRLRSSFTTYIIKAQLTRTQRQLLYNRKEATQLLRINMAAEQDVLNCTCRAEGLKLVFY